MQQLMQEMLSNFEGESPPEEAGEIMAWISVHEDVDGPKLRKLAKRLGTDRKQKSQLHPQGLLLKI